jgi:hypothetical protein
MKTVPIMSVIPTVFFGRDMTFKDLIWTTLANCNIKIIR